jgi:hypothetical protein
MWLGRTGAIAVRVEEAAAIIIAEQRQDARAAQQASRYSAMRVSFSS